MYGHCVPHFPTQSTLCLTQCLPGLCHRPLPYKTLFPPGIQLHNPPSFLVEQARFARIRVACVADYQIRESPITGAGPPKIF